MKRALSDGHEADECCARCRYGLVSTERTISAVLSLPLQHLLLQECSICTLKRLVKI